jgi:hypothetical protein
MWASGCHKREFQAAASSSASSISFFGRCSHAESCTTQHTTHNTQPRWWPEETALPVCFSVLLISSLFSLSCFSGEGGGLESSPCALVPVHPYLFFSRPNLGVGRQETCGQQGEGEAHGVLATAAAAAAAGRATTGCHKSEND